METTTMGYIGIVRYVLGIYWGYMGDNGKENGNERSSTLFGV